MASELDDGRGRSESPDQPARGGADDRKANSTDRARYTCFSARKARTRGVRCGTGRARAAGGETHSKIRSGSCHCGSRLRFDESRCNGGPGRAQACDTGSHAEGHSFFGQLFGQTHCSVGEERCADFGAALETAAVPADAEIRFA